MVKIPAKKRFIRIINKNWRLYTLMLPALILVIVFMYIPMYGVVIAFKDFNIRAGIMGSPWAGLKYFEQFFSTNIASTVIKNTLFLSVLALLWGFPVPIIFALLLNQIKRTRPRKIIQTVSYAPYFVSNVVVVGIMTVILAPSTGFVNTIVQALGSKPVLFMTRPEYFRSLYIVSGIWQRMGFSAIIYIAALTSISPTYYEAAIVDGATKVQRIIHIDIPLIIPTVVILFVLQIGRLMSVGYEKVYLMQGGMNLAVSEIISTYVYKTGLLSAQYSFSTAVGLFNSTINLTLLVVANTIARKVSKISLF